MGKSGSLAVKPPSEVVSDPLVNQEITTFDLEIGRELRGFRKKESPKNSVGEMFKQGKFFFLGDKDQFLT